jgi:Xaa-Pro aminopeptidase
MDPDFAPLDTFLREEGYDGYLLHDDGTNSDQRYVSGFDAPDPFATLYTPGGTYLLVSGLEYGRATKESRADGVVRPAEYVDPSKIDDDSLASKARPTAAFLEDHGVESVATPYRFPGGVADGLREHGVAVDADPRERVEGIRAVKTDEEIEHVRAAQAANESAMAAAERLLRAADVADDGSGTLRYEGETLTSERVKKEIEVALLREGCALDETIVACGSDAADPHDRGSGPLRAETPIIVDIFPRSKATKYHADMSRTFSVGDPGETVREWFDLTHEALEAALDAVEPGATGEAVHAAACDVYEDAGHPTLRSDPTTETGFIHSTGHGVGLDVHEQPHVSPGGGELEPGHVITVEPGLYDPDVGGVRIEDLVVVTEDGYENLTDYPVELVVDRER